MKNTIWAKVFGWVQFGLVTASQFASGVQTNGVPHGWANWTLIGASLATAIATHNAAKTDGSN